MAQERLEQLKIFAEQRPDDPFPLYGLAMEFKKQGLSDDARRTFERILDRFPDYLPAYYHAGQFFEGLGEREKAVEIWRAGIVLCEKKGDGKTRAEIEDCLAALD